MAVMTLGYDSPMISAIGIFCTVIRSNRNDKISQKRGETRWEGTRTRNEGEELESTQSVNCGSGINGSDRTSGEIDQKGFSDRQSVV